MMNDFDKPVVVVVPGDLHLTEPDLDNVRVAHRWSTTSTRLIRPGFRPVHRGQRPGRDRDQFRLFDRSVASSRFRTCADRRPRHGGRPARTGIPSPVRRALRRMISLRRLAFIRLNTQECGTKALSTTQIDWFRESVDQATAGASAW